MIEEYFKMAFKGIKQRRIRAWLTMIGIFIGIASVTTMISLGQGVNNALEAQFQILGGDKIFILPGSGGGLGALIGSITSTVKLDKKDLDVVLNTPGIKTASHYIMSSAGVLKKDEFIGTFVMGMPTDDGTFISQLQGYSVVGGRDFKKTDTFSAQVGYQLWATDNFFDKPAKIRDTIQIAGKNFRIIATLSKVGNRIDDSVILIPEATARDLFERGDEVDGIIAQVQAGSKPSTISEIIKERLRKSRNVKEGKEDFVVETTENIIQQVGAILSLVQAVFIGIAAISLVVGGVGIMNTMYTSVLERTREIGIMKAVGAKRNQILLLFLIESGLYGVVGGIVGSLAGISVSKSIEFAVRYAEGIDILKIQLSIPLIIGVIAFSFFVGVLSGALPAKQAAELQPVDALRYE